MLSLPGRPVRTCDGTSRRELLRAGGLSLLGLSLPEFLRLQASSTSQTKITPRAKQVIMIFLQGGPSHLDIWDPKPDAPANIRGEFSAIPTKVDGIQVSETMPMLAKVMDKVTLIRSMSYTPVGLFNHTAAMYQMMTGWAPDKVSPSGQLEPPSPRDFPHMGCHIGQMLPPSGPMFPFVEMPRPLQESQVIGKGGAAGFLGKAHDPYRLYQDPNKEVKLDDLSMRTEVSQDRLKDRFELLKGINGSMKDLEKAVSSYALNEYYEKAYDLVLSGKARDAFDLAKEPGNMRERYGRHTFGQSCLMARRLIEAGTRFVQVNWPSVANGNPETDAWDTHAANFGPLKNLHCPKLDRALSALLEDMDTRGLLKETLVVVTGEFGRSPKLGVSTSGNVNSPDGRDHWPYCYTAVVAGGGMKRGVQYGASDATASAPTEKALHPAELVATIYYSLGIDPALEVLNDLKQPRKLVEAEPALGLFA
ncbi:MAG: DUF1501 domain-containing protein [Acidimicrobiia bacterium]|nr:DUF1501 domain-containing protein [Acidimicrobiia bacterium]